MLAVNLSEDPLHDMIGFPFAQEPGKVWHELLTQLVFHRSKARGGWPFLARLRRIGKLQSFIGFPRGSLGEFFNSVSLPVRKVVRGAVLLSPSASWVGALRGCDQVCGTWSRLVEVHCFATKIWRRRFNGDRQRKPRMRNMLLKTKVGLLTGAKIRHESKSPGEFVRALEPVKSIMNLPKHARPLEKGQLPAGIFVLLRGNAKLFASLKNGKQIILQVMRPGEVLGFRPRCCAIPLSTKRRPSSWHGLFTSHGKISWACSIESLGSFSSTVEVLSYQLREAVNMVRYSSGSQAESTSNFS